MILEWDMNTGLGMRRSGKYSRYPSGLDIQRLAACGRC
jgi:hypothetical protein